MLNKNELLEEVIDTQLSELKNFPIGSEERKKAISELAELCQLRTDYYKANSEELRVNNECIKALADNKHEKNDKVIQWAKIGVAAAELALPLMFYGVWMNRGFKFEETGAFTSTTFRSLFSKFKPIK